MTRMEWERKRGISKEPYKKQSAQGQPILTLVPVTISSDLVVNGMITHRLSPTGGRLCFPVYLVVLGSLTLRCCGEQKSHSLALFELPLCEEKLNSNCNMNKNTAFTGQSLFSVSEISSYPALRYDETCGRYSHFHLAKYLRQQLFHGLALKVFQYDSFIFKFVLS